LLIGVLSPVHAQDAKINYQKAADAADFKWSEKEASVLYSLSAYSGDDEVQLIRNPRKQRWPLDYTIRFLRDNKPVLSITGHRYTVFKAVEDMVYYADFSFVSSGCTIVAYDLNQQKQLWRTQLQAMGMVSHSEYFNTITLDADERVISVFGREISGDYLEYLDARSGKTVGHKIFRIGNKIKLQ
jgi:hypothetical protein